MTLFRESLFPAGNSSEFLGGRACAEAAGLGRGEGRGARPRDRQEAGPMARVGDGAGPKSRDGDGAERGEVGGA